MLLDLNTDIDKQIAGFRLTRLEVFNWGTFDQQVWTITPQGTNALLTGDIGSGKSTLVDAITTLLVPHQKITFNKAAGAETRERNLRSYIKGAYKNEKVAHSGKARDVYLRPGQDHYTVLLAVFTNVGLGQSVTLAQVFYLQQDQVKKFYVLAQQDRSIIKDFSNFGSNINALKKRLRQADQHEVFDSFTDYSNRFRQIFGIRQPEALDLFYQTVSMKSVGNLTDFVRDQMLGQTNIQQYVDDLVRRYQELTEAHQAVQVARDQHELLHPLITDADRRENVLAKISALEQVVEEIPRYFARQQFVALQQVLHRRHADWQQNEEESLREGEILREQRADLASQRAALAGLGVNQRLTAIALELDPLTKERDRQQRQAQQYADCSAQLTASDPTAAFTVPTDPAGFVRSRQALETTLAAATAALDQLNHARPDLHVRKDRHQQLIRELDQELTSLRQRPTQIPERNLQLRAGLLQQLQLTDQDPPFAGELLRVRDDAKDWEGAIERQLHSFGLSLLVPDRYYPAVSELVDRQRLAGKLVYLRTLEHHKLPADKPGESSLVRKVGIKGETEFYEWLEKELWVRYDYTCCDTLEEFRRAPRGLTRQGQSKSSRITHTKDDRYAVNDRRQYILGWTNKEKIAALELARVAEAQALATVEADLAALRQREKQLDEQRRLIQELLRFTDFSDLDYPRTAARIQALREEQRQLESESGELQLLQARIRELEQLIARSEQAQTQRSEARGELRGELVRTAQRMYDLLELLQIVSPAVATNAQGLPDDMDELHAAFMAVALPPAVVSKTLQQRLSKEIIPPQLDVKALLTLEHRLLESIRGNRGAIARQHDELNRLNGAIIRGMDKFRNRYPDEAREIDADVRAIPEFRELHQRLVQDDIPRHEERFRELLKQGAIRGILSFKTKLEDYEREVTAKIESINQHLREIDYNPGTYIAIAAEPVRTDDILTFKQQLRACLDNIYGEQDNIYTEEKFFQVKTLLDRFRGETEDDTRWTRRVTDVRQWYTFGADERYREDDKSFEYYTDSSGKSGGQKEKLAYTILASAIAFQFGLERGKARDRSFRFVVIDEAFGRGSDESTRYGLQLFERLNLQLLIVTPLQKINVIEDYISAVHFVSNPSGKNSLVRNISKAEYAAEKAAFVAAQQAES